MPSLRLLRNAFCATGLALLIAPSALAWNAAGHRLSAMIAWSSMHPASQTFVMRQLERHPDAARWREKAGTPEPAAHFAEAATWADEIRNDPRFYDETRETATNPVPGLADQARHKRWHYVDFDENWQAKNGELNRRLPELIQLLIQEPESQEGAPRLSWALLWLIHLVGDAHQPLHVGRVGDAGGNDVEVEFSQRPKQPFGNLHEFWDKLPGRSSLRGRRLEQRAAELLAQTSLPPSIGHPADWLRESHRLLDRVYPDAQGSLLPLIDRATEESAKALADQRITLAGYRLGKLIDQIVVERVSRETSKPSPVTRRPAEAGRESKP